MTDRAQEVVKDLELLCATEGLIFTDELRQRIESFDFKSVKKYIRPIEKPDGSKVVIKLRPSFSDISLEDFIDSEQYLDKVSKSLQQQGIRVSQTISTHLNQPPLWVVREYIEGEILGKLVINKLATTIEIVDFVRGLRQKLDRVYQIGSLDLEALDWLKSWQNEYRDRVKFVEKHFGQTIAETIASQLAKVGQTNLTQSIVHSDLAPANIIQTNHGLVAIDWGGTRLGPKAVDAMTVWWFCLENIPARQQIIHHLLADCQTESEKAETKDIARRVTGRMLATFAENFDYYSTAGDEDSKYFAELTRLFPLAEASLDSLDQMLADAT